jgi:hypothetical protein
VFPFRDTTRTPAAPASDVDDDPPVHAPRARRAARHAVHQRSPSPPSTPPQYIVDSPPPSTPSTTNSIVSGSSSASTSHGSSRGTSPPPTAPSPPTSPEPTAAADLHQPPPHPMITRGRAGIHKPNPKYAMVVPETLSPIPRSVRSAVKDPHWYAAMKKEYDALLANKTWTLVPRPPGAHVISGKWVFKHKMNPDGTLERYKSSMGRSWLQSTSWSRLRRNLLAGGQAGDHPHRPDDRGDQQVAGAPA